MPFILRNLHGDFPISRPQDWERVPRTSGESVSVDGGRTFSPYDSTNAAQVRELRAALGLPVLPGRPPSRSRAPLPDVDDMVSIPERGWGDHWDGYKPTDDDGTIPVDERDVVEAAEEVLVARVIAVTPSTSEEENSADEAEAAGLRQEIETLRQEVAALRALVGRQEESMQALRLAQQTLQREVEALRQPRSGQGVDVFPLPDLSLD